MYTLINYYKVKQYLTITQVNKQNIASTQNCYVFLPNHISLLFHKVTTLLTLKVITPSLFFIVSPPMYVFLQIVVLFCLFVNFT